MIRDFELFCKLKNIKISESQLFKQSLESFDPETAPCPYCGAKGSFKKHSMYQRYLIYIHNRDILVETISVPRYLCACGHTHALLPACIVPYGSYSLFFVITVLREYFLQHKTVEALCDSFHISVSTLYAWIRLYHRHKALWLGVLADLEVTSSAFLESLMKETNFLQSFFQRMAFSFLQGMSFTTLSQLSLISDDS